MLATLHEAGHALYDQGLPRELHGTLLADVPSIGLHESQARLWENHVGRSRAFWAHYFPKLRGAVPASFGWHRCAWHAPRHRRHCAELESGCR